MSSSGKVLIVFLVIAAILLITLTAVSLFFFQKETERRKLAEATLEEYRVEKTRLDNELKEAKKQNFLLQERNKEADERINDLSDELDLEKGLREEMKIETASLKKRLEEASEAKEVLAGQIKAKEELVVKITGELSASQQKIKELEDRLTQEARRGEELRLIDEKRRREESRQPPREPGGSGEPAAGTPPPEEAGISEGDAGGRAADTGIELGEIVVGPSDAARKETAGAPAPPDETAAVPGGPAEGRVLSVDIETEFVIVNLGEQDGLAVGSVLSVYRGGEYVGDIQITRLQPEMSAADLVPPVSIRNIRKNDQVQVK